MGAESHVSATPIFQSALFAAAAGFLTRPCCFIPAALPLAGVGSAGLSAVFMTHRLIFAFGGARYVS